MILYGLIDVLLTERKVILLSSSPTTDLLHNVELKEKKKITSNSYLQNIKNETHISRFPLFSTWKGLQSLLALVIE